MEMIGERRQSFVLIPLLDRVDQALVLLEDLEQVAWIAPRPHLHKADEASELVQELGYELQP
jgi:hypothetical protein